MKEHTELVGYIVSAITGDKDCFSIRDSIDEKGVLIELGLDQEYLGRVIGRSGQTAVAIRTVLKALGHKNDARYSLKIEERKDELREA